MVKKTQKKSSKLIAWLIILVLVSGGLIAGYGYYKKVFAPNIFLPEGQKTAFLYIHTGADFDQVAATLEKNGWIRNQNSFRWVAEKMNFTGHVHPGRFQVSDRMSNYQIIKVLRANLNIPVKLVLNDQKTIEQLAGYFGSQLEIDSARIMNALLDSAFLLNNSLTRDNVLTFFIPNSYQVYWNISLEDFLKKMEKEYLRFWNDNRLRKAKKIDLTPAEVTILASIVQGETNRSGEMSRVAGVYLNRLKTGMKLEADPTVAFLIRDRKVLRVYAADLKINSPYNTYQHAGLPPGPIGFAQIRYIDAVLNAEKHNYLYFCARPDNSGYHNFSHSVEQHNIYAREYRKYLDSLNIR